MSSTRTLLAAALLALALGATAQEFYHDAYVKTTLDDIYATAPKITEGADVFFKKRQFVATLRSAPEKCKTGWIDRVFMVLGIKEPPPANYCINVESANGKKVEMHVQDVLVDALREEVKVGTEFRAFAAYLWFNGHTQQPGFLLSEFDADASER